MNGVSEPVVVRSELRSDRTQPIPTVPPRKLFFTRSCPQVDEIFPQPVRRGDLLLDFIIFILDSLVIDRRYSSIRPAEKRFSAAC